GSLRLSTRLSTPPLHHPAAFVLVVASLGDPLSVPTISLIALRFPQRERNLISLSAFIVGLSGVWVRETDY
ncbi:MAG: hypothetical protein V3U06_09485, partial [Candidatus Binatia bacterium]